MGSFLTALVCLALLLFLATIIRFPFIGPARAKGSQKRLQQPEFSEVQSKRDVKLTESLEKFLRTDIVTRSDFYLAPPGTDRSKWWCIEGFLPFTCRDLAEWIKITNVPGIPIALDASKGTYYLPFESLRHQSQSSVLLRLPGLERKDLHVASTFDEFAQFEPKDNPPED